MPAVGWRKKVLFRSILQLFATNGNSTRIQLQIYDGAERCHVVTRVRVDLGRTTEVLDRGITEMEEDREARTHLHTHRHVNTQKTATKRPNGNETNASMCMYIYVFGLRQLQPASRRDRTPAPAHALREARWRLCRKHSGVPRSRVSLPKTCAEWLWRMTEERSSVPVRQHFVLPNARYLLHSSPSLFVEISSSTSLI